MVHLTEASRKGVSGPRRRARKALSLRMPSPSPIRRLKRENTMRRMTVGLVSAAAFVMACGGGKKAATPATGAAQRPDSAARARDTSGAARAAAASQADTLPLLVAGNTEPFWVVTVLHTGMRYASSEAHPEGL